MRECVRVWGGAQWNGVAGGCGSVGSNVHSPIHQAYRHDREYHDREAVVRMGIGIMNDEGSTGGRFTRSEFAVYVVLHHFFISVTGVGCRCEG